MSDTSLDEIFSGEPVETEVEVQVEAPVETEEVVTTEVETTETVEPEKTETEEAVAEPVEDAKTVPLAAIHEEREKRRDIEKRFNALTEQVGALLPHLSKLGGKEPPAEPAKLDFYADPQAFVTDNLTGLEKRINQSLGSTLMAMSETQARARHDDFDATLEAFANLTKEQPEIRAKLRSVPDPAEWAYGFVKKHEAIEAVGSDPVAYEAKLRAKWEAEQATVDTPAAPVLPKSLATARNVGAGKRSTGPGWQGPTSLDATFAGAPGRAKK